MKLFFVCSTWEIQQFAHTTAHSWQTKAKRHYFTVKINFSDTPIKPGSMGLPAPGYEIRRVDDDGKEVPQGEQGMIAVQIVSNAK